MRRNLRLWIAPLPMSIRRLYLKQVLSASFCLLHSLFSSFSTKITAIASRLVRLHSSPGFSPVQSPVHPWVSQTTKHQSMLVILKSSSGCLFSPNKIQTLQFGIQACQVLAPACLFSSCLLHPAYSGSMPAYALPLPPYGGNYCQFFKTTGIM